jgi:ADP-ribose pyrophosphatase
MTGKRSRTAALTRVHRRRLLYRGKVFSVERHWVREPGGIEAIRDFVVHLGSVVVIPELPDGRILLVQQYRHPVSRVLWELVAGRIEPGETPLQAARRELVEETGYSARELRRLCTFYPSPGLLSERMVLFHARGLRPGPARPEADEYLRVAAWTRERLQAALRNRRILDGKTMIGLLHLFCLPEHDPVR